MFVGKHFEEGRSVELDESLEGGLQLVVGGDATGKLKSIRLCGADKVFAVQRLVGAGKRPSK